MSDFRNSLPSAEELAACGCISLAELAKDPANLRPPVPVLPRLVYEGRTTLLVGREKLAGKSTFARDAAAAVVNGQRFLGDPVVPGLVLWPVLDEARADVAAKLIAVAGKDPAVVLQDMELERRVEQVTKTVCTFRPKLIVIDTLTSFVEGERITESDPNAWTRILNQLRRLAESVDAGMLILHHATKRDGGYRGSTAIGASVDQIVEIQDDHPDKCVRTLTVRGRYTSEEFAVRFDEKTKRFSLVDSSEEKAADAAATEAEARMLRWLSENPEATRTKATKQAGCRAEEARKVFDAMASRGRVVSSGRGWRVADAQYTAAV